MKFLKDEYNPITLISASQIPKVEDLGEAILGLDMENAILYGSDRKSVKRLVVAGQSTGDIDGAIEHHNSDDIAHIDFNFIVSVNYDSSTGIVTFGFRDGSISTINVDNLIANVDYDPITKELIFTRTDGSTFRVPVADLIDIYTGDQTSTITVSVDSSNVITASIKPHSITINELNTEVTNIFNDKLDANLGIANTGKILTIDNLGNIVPSEVIDGGIIQII